MIFTSYPPSPTSSSPLPQGFGGHYDVILTSEGIYNQDSQWRLLECIKQVRRGRFGDRGVYGGGGRYAGKEMGRGGGGSQWRLLERIEQVHEGGRG